MDRPTAQSEPPQAGRTPAVRDMMYCHQCHDEWYRDEHGFTCPECHSDFTEIIEQDNDPRDDEVIDHGDHGDDDDSMPDLEEAPHHDHPPWPNDDDPDEGDISNMEWRQLGPGRFAVRTTMYRNVPPGVLGAGGVGPVPSGLGGIASFLNNIVGGGVTLGQPGDGANTPDGHTQTGSGTAPGGHHYTYTAGARLFPRDVNNPGPQLGGPPDQIHDMLVGLMAAFTDQPGDPHHHHHNHPAHHHGDGPLPGFPFAPGTNPFVGLLAQIMGGGQAGDAVYSQEALDRVISQLMEQNVGSNAPGPASQQDIDALPRKPVTEDMMGAEGRADCSICMDEVNIGEEVTHLPCKHWFHHACIEAWLTTHDTCPHCRKGITKHDANDNPANPTNTASHGEASRTMPGAFNVGGEGTSGNPYVVEGASGQPNTHDTSASADESSSSAGIGDRIRRGLFGPPR